MPFEKQCPSKRTLMRSSGGKWLAPPGKLVQAGTQRHNLERPLLYREDYTYHASLIPNDSVSWIAQWSPVSLCVNKI